MKASGLGLLMLMACSPSGFVVVSNGVCNDAQPERLLARHREVLHAYLGIKDKAGVITVSVAATHDACPDGAACARPGHVFSNRLLDEHELIHAYLAPHGATKPIWREGLAVALDCANVYPVVSNAFDLRQWDGSLYREAYGSAGRLVALLIRRGGIAKFMEMYLGTPEDATPDAVSERVFAAYGYEYTTLLSEALSAPPACIPVWRCVADIEEACDLNPRRRAGPLTTFDTPVLLHRNGAIHQELYRCSDFAPLFADGVWFNGGAHDAFVAPGSVWSSFLVEASDPVPEAPGFVVAQSGPVFEVEGAQAWDLPPVDDEEPLRFRTTLATSVTLLAADACTTLQVCDDGGCVEVSEQLEVPPGTYGLRVLHACVPLAAPSVVVSPTQSR